MAFIPKVLKIVAVFIQFITCAPSKPAASPAMIDPDRIHCMKEGSIAEVAREALKDLDESLLDVDTNCEDADEDDDEDSDCDSDCDDNEEIDI